MIYFSDSQCVNHFSNTTIWGKIERLCLLILLSRNSVIKYVQGNNELWIHLKNHLISQNYQDSNRIYKWNWTDLLLTS